MTPMHRSTPAAAATMTVRSMLIGSWPGRQGRAGPCRRIAAAARPPRLALRRGEIVRFRFGGIATIAAHACRREGPMPDALIHTMIRVLDEERSLAFYRGLGFEERGRRR